MPFLYKVMLCDFRTVFGALVSSSLDPRVEPNAGEWCMEGRWHRTEFEGVKHERITRK